LGLTGNVRRFTRFDGDLMSGQLIYVMGPSGAGKDSLLSFAREKIPGEPVVFAHRYITRAAGEGENHIALTREEFEARSALGLFALEWSSHALRYGIGIELDAWLARGCTVVVNGSRAHLARALARYPRAVVVHVDAAPHILEARLGARARETPEQVAARLERRARFTLPEGVSLTVIDNSGALEDAGHAFVEVVRRAATQE
jgi:ribose 1,5-bisphosphokinase